ncbi:T9SS type A sorting domain-containing protein [candidate division WOR-3 bacterium]|nr:T9SS type A sorting domain-containing protein [candidate division WOR-3 bacterium]
MLFLMCIICQWGSEDLEAKTFYPEPSRYYEARAESIHAYDVLKYELDVFVPMTGRSMQGVNRITCRSQENGLNTLVLHSYTLTIDSVKVDGVTATFSAAGESLVVNSPQTYNSGDSFDIEVAYHGSWTVTSSQTGFVFYPKNYNSSTLHGLAYTLGEPWDARRWMPCYDEPYDKADYGCVIKVTVPDTFVVCANGELTSIVNNPNNTKTYTWQEDYPITTYLMHFGVSKYAQWSDWYYGNSGDTVEIRHFMWPEDSAFSHTSFQYMPAAMYLFDSLYGSYPFSRYGQNVVYPYAWGGMEHQEQTTIHRTWLLNQSERGMAHELAHMWWGDMVTCIDFRDIWLNEGFATYSDANYIWYRFGHTDFINLMQSRAQTYYQADQAWRHPLYDPPVSELFNYGYTYCKASWVMHMLRYLDEDSYYPAIAVYRDQFEYGNASTEDLKAVFSTAYGTDLTWFFDEWVYGQGYPQYRVYWQCEPAGSDYQTTIVIHQAQTNAPIFHMPVEIMLDFPGPGDTLVSVDIAGSPQAFSITLPDSVTSIAVDPNVWLLKACQIFVGVEDFAQDLPYSDFSFVANPARNPSIRLALTYRSEIDLAVFDVAGRCVMQQAVGVLVPGVHAIDVGRLAAGVYFCVLKTEQEEITRKLVVVN